METNLHLFHRKMSHVNLVCSFIFETLHETVEIVWEFSHIFNWTLNTLNTHLIYSSGLVTPTLHLLRFCHFFLNFRVLFDSIIIHLKNNRPWREVLAIHFSLQTLFIFILIKGHSHIKNWINEWKDEKKNAHKFEYLVSENENHLWKGTIEYFIQCSNAWIKKSIIEGAFIAGIKWQRIYFMNYQLWKLTSLSTSIGTNLVLILNIHTKIINNSRIEFISGIKYMKWWWSANVSHQLFVMTIWII